MRRAHTFASICLLSVVASCGGPAEPSRSAPIVTSIAPNAGTTLGGTVITITGTNFLAGASVSLGGTPATDVTTTSPTVITATTGQRASGVVDVVVSVGGALATLPAGFTYTAPSAVVNTPPSIASMSARGTRGDEPPQFADVGEEIDVVATVQDAETPVSQLTYEWTSTAGGTFSGSGAAAKWRAPQAAGTPLTATLTLTVIERYSAFDSNGLPMTSENRVSKSIAVSLHDSLAEVGGMARQFLLDFSDSNIRDVNYIMRNFTDTTSVCSHGKASETSDVKHNRDTFRITSSFVGPADVIIAFGTICRVQSAAGDACAFVPVDWVSTILADGTREHAWGTDQVSAIYVPNEQRWGLCASNFDGHNSPANRHDFIR